VIGVLSSTDDGLWGCVGVLLDDNLGVHIGLPIEGIAAAAAAAENAALHLPTARGGTASESDTNVRFRHFDDI